jgi:hypothetical protein
MAKKKEPADELAGTVEGLARDHFEKEKAAYEERTGQKVLFEPPVPVSRTPLTPDPVSDEQTLEGEGEVSE